MSYGESDDYNTTQGSTGIGGGRLDPSGERGRAAGREQFDESVQGRDTGLGQQGGDTSGYGQHETGEQKASMIEKLKGQAEKMTGKGEGHGSHSHHTGAGTTHQEPSLMDKIKGGAEKMSHKSKDAERGPGGQARQEGQFESSTGKY